MNSRVYGGKIVLEVVVVVAELFVLVKVVQEVAVTKLRAYLYV